MRLYVVRHGSTNNNVKKIINGRKDVDINNQGLKESGIVSLMLDGIDFDKAYCSPLLRAKHTMNIINSSDVPVIYDERLTERDAGIMTGKPVSSLDLSLWYKLDDEVISGGCESFKEVVIRVKEFLDEIKSKHSTETVLLVTHSGIMKALEVCIFGYPGVDEIVNWKYSNGTVMRYEL